MKIYKITNTINNKIYIGATMRNLEERLAEHKRKKNSLVGKALNELGDKFFTVEVIDTAETKDELMEKERFYVEYFNCLVPNGYNQCAGGGKTIGYSHSEESREKMSKTRRATLDFYGEKNPFYGKHHSPEQIEKWKRDRKGRKPSQKAIDASNEAQRRPVINLTTGEVFNSVKEAAVAYNIAPTNISRCCRETQRRVRDCYWRHLEKTQDNTVPSPDKGKV